MKLSDLAALDRDTLLGAIRGRQDALVPAPRPPFDIGVRADGAVVVGPDGQYAFEWRGDDIVAAGRVVATRPRTGRFAVDARALVDAVLADVGGGAWLIYSSRGNRTYGRITSGAMVGRGEHAALRIPTGTVARHHCRFEKVGEQWFVEDLRSTNGTWVRGQRIERAPIADGDVIAAAGEELVFRASIVPRLRPIDPADDATWSQLYLDRVELGFLEHDPPVYTPEPPGHPAAIRGGRVRWSGYRDLTGTDTRWLFGDAAEAEVFTDVLLGDERDELPAPVVGDLCACFRAGDGLDAIVRIERLVARLAVSDASRDLDVLASTIVARAVR